METKHWFRREQTQTWKGKGKTSEHQEEAKLNIDCIFLLQGEMLGIRQFEKQTPQASCGFAGLFFSHMITSQSPARDPKQCVIEILHGKVERILKSSVAPS